VNLKLKVGKNKVKGLERRRGEKLEEERMF